jgi:L-rhamnose mutarotase
VAKQIVMPSIDPQDAEIVEQLCSSDGTVIQQKIDGKWYEFKYWEYTGKDYESDMAGIAKEPRTIEWLKVCDPMQIPLPGAKSWKNMERVYFNK